MLLQKNKFLEPAKICKMITLEHTPSCCRSFGHARMHPHATLSCQYPGLQQWLCTGGKMQLLCVVPDAGVAMMARKWMCGRQGCSCSLCWQASSLSRPMMTTTSIILLGFTTSGCSKSRPPGGCRAVVSECTDWEGTVGVALGKSSGELAICC